MSTFTERRAGEITYRLTFKKMKNVHLSVKEDPNGSPFVLVTAPLRTPVSFIDQFVLEHREWIEKQIRAREKAGEDADHYLCLFGNRYPLLVVAGRSNHLVIEKKERLSLQGVKVPGAAYDEKIVPGGDGFDEIAVLTLKNPADQAAKRRFLNGFLRTRLATAIEERLPLWQDRMGLAASGVRIRDMKSRWGSCNVRTGEIHLNLQLVRLEEKCLDYVIVHELAHLSEASHNERFWRIVETYIPDYKRVRKEMRDGQ